MKNGNGTMNNMYSYCAHSAAAASVRLSFIVGTTLSVVSILLALAVRLLTLR